MKRRFIPLLAAVAVVASGSAASAQKMGGTLKIAHRDNPPSASIHEEATISTVMPFASIYNNLVLFDPRRTSRTPATTSFRSSRPNGSGRKATRISPSSCATA